MKILIAILFIIPTIAFGQEKPKKKPRPFQDGYIIYGDNRKPEKGLVQVPEKKGGLDKFNFRKSTTGIIREIRVEEEGIAGFGFHNGAEYHAVDYTHDDTSRKFFIKVLIDGNLSLLNDGDTLILKLQTGTTIELTSSNFRKVLKDATATCPAANQVAEYIRFDPDVLGDFVKGYNRCLENDPSTYDPFATKKRIYLGISSGIEFTTIDIEGLGFYPPYSLSDENHIFAGLLLYVPFAKSQALEFGVIYKPREYKGSEKRPVINLGYRTSTINLSYNEIVIPATFRQALWRKNKTTLHGSAGVAIPVIISQSGQIASKDTDYQFVKPISFSKSIQYNLGIGVEIAVKERQRLLIQNILFFGPASLSTFLGHPGTSYSGYTLFIAYAL